jgi:hypothetical protein
MLPRYCRAGIARALPLPLQGLHCRDGSRRCLLEGGAGHFLCRCTDTSSATARALPLPLHRHFICRCAGTSSATARTLPLPQESPLPLHYRESPPAMGRGDASWRGPRGSWTGKSPSARRAVAATATPASTLRACVQCGPLARAAPAARPSGRRPRAWASRAGRAEVCPGVGGPAPAATAGPGPGRGCCDVYNRLDSLERCVSTGLCVLACVDQAQAVWQPVRRVAADQTRHKSLVDTLAQCVDQALCVLGCVSTHKPVGVSHCRPGCQDVHSESPLAVSESCETE